MVCFSYGVRRSGVGVLAFLLCCFEGAQLPCVSYLPVSYLPVSPLFPPSSLIYALSPLPPIPLHLFALQSLPLHHSVAWLSSWTVDLSCESAGLVAATKPQRKDTPDISIASFCDDSVFMYLKAGCPS